MADFNCSWGMGDVLYTIVPVLNVGEGEQCVIIDKRRGERLVKTQDGQSVWVRLGDMQTLFYWSGKTDVNALLNTSSVIEENVIER